MSDRSTELHVAQVENTKLPAAYVLSALALSLWGAAGVELVLPMVTAAAVLHLRSRSLRTPK